MKSRGFKLVLCLSILFSLIAASFALVKPLYLSLYKGLRSNIINLNSSELNQSLNQLCNKLDQSINENNKYFSNFTLKLNSMKNSINSQIDYLKTSSNHSVNGPFKYYSSKSVNPIRFKYGSNWASNDDIVNVSTRESDYYLKRLKTAK